jgi:hypothetical protein
MENGNTFDIDTNYEDPQLCEPLACDIYKHLREAEVIASCSYDSSCICQQSKCILILLCNPRCYLVCLKCIHHLGVGENGMLHLMQRTNSTHIFSVFLSLNKKLQ